MSLISRETAFLNKGIVNTLIGPSRAVRSSWSNTVKSLFSLQKLNGVQFSLNIRLKLKLLAQQHYMDTNLAASQTGSLAIRWPAMNNNWRASRAEDTSVCSPKRVTEGLLCWPTCCLPASVLRAKGVKWSSLWRSWMRTYSRLPVALLYVWNVWLQCKTARLWLGGTTTRQHAG
jgi:hypothetical protein